MATFPADVIQKPEWRAIIAAAFARERDRELAREAAVAKAMAREHPQPDVTLTIPVVTVNELNAHEHWRVRQRRAKTQHHAVDLSARVQRVVTRLRDLYPSRVKFTRVAPGNGLDRGDNLNSSFKHVRDAVCKLIGKDDRHSGYVWEYDQRRGAKGECAVIVEVTRIEAQ